MLQPPEVEVPRDASPVPHEVTDITDAIGVYARVRPGPAGITNEIIVRKSYGVQKDVQVRNLEFSMDWVFDEDATQQEVYDIVGERRVQRVLQGYNVCLLAYGQTGSGKTFTMFGPDSVMENWQKSSEEEYGLAPRAISAFFDGVTSLPEDKQYLVTCSSVEVYNDQCNDLLGGRKGLSVREAADGRVSVEGLSKEVVSSPGEVMEAVKRGNANRVVAAMKMNARSSRSHVIFSIGLSEVGGEEGGRLYLVDLAGMESSKKSYSVEGASSKPMRREEARNINTSLYALGSVIERLSASSRHHHHPAGAAGGAGAEGGGAGGVGAGVHIPYRDSKLTRVLQECLGGNCASAIVVTLRAEPQNLDETLGTLRFAQRARAVPVAIRPVQSVKGDAARWVEGGRVSILGGGSRGGGEGGGA